VLNKLTDYTVEPILTKDVLEDGYVTPEDTMITIIDDRVAKSNTSKR